MRFSRILMGGVAAMALLAVAPAGMAADKTVSAGAHNGITVAGDYLLSANEIIGQTVYGETGRALATVDDVIITRADHVVLAVLSVGGFLAGIPHMGSSDEV